MRQIAAKLVGAARRAWARLAGPTATERMLARLDAEL
jgi:hypothetical protein